MRNTLILKTAKTRILTRALYKALSTEELVNLLKEALSRALSDKARDFLVSLFQEIERLGGAEALKPEDVERIRRMAEEFLGEDLFSVAKRQIFEGVARGYELGLGTSFTESDAQAAQLAGRASYMPLKGYWEERLKPKMEELLKQAVQEGWSRRRLAERLEEMFGKHVEGDMHYFETVADLAIYRAREMGRVSGFVRAGVEYVRVDAVLDRRCCRICRAMHGRTIAVREVKAQVDNFLQAAEAGDLNGMKRAWPMWTTKMFREAGLDAPGVRTKDMTKMGLRTPPFHFRCRCTLVAHFEPASDWEKIRQNILNGELSSKDVREILRRALSATWSKRKYGRLTSAEWHFRKHAEKLGLETLTDYNQFIQDMLRRGGRKIFVAMPDRLENQKILTYFVKKAGKGNVFLVIDTEEREIKTCFYRRRLAQAIKKNDVIIELPEGVTKWTKKRLEEYLERLWIAVSGP